ncbi:MAG: aryl-sulfate sulfotransferase [Bacteroidia bacterium]
MKQLLSLLAISFCTFSLGQNTVGLIEYQQSNLDGYIMFSPMGSTETYLIDKCGEKVHSWNSSAYRPALSAAILEDGSLLRTGKLSNSNFNEGGSGGILERFDWNGDLTWSYTISTANNCMHHDFKVLPNGNILVIVWDRYTYDEAISNGMNLSYPNSNIWSEKLIELQPIGSDSAEIVWEWKLWNHLVQEYDNSKPNYGEVSEHPELININYFPGQASSQDWIHLNSVDYNPLLNQLIVSSHTFHEVWVIDHSTTTSEAAGHVGGSSGKGGDILYRWGNPQAYQRGNPSTKKFYSQHHATWIPQGYPNAGKILVFNNGLNRPGTFSSIDIISPPIDTENNYIIEVGSAYLPSELFWTYSDNPQSDFYSSNISGVHALENGSFLITSGTSGRLFEIDSTKQIVWEYINPIASSGPIAQGANPVNNLVFRCEFYPISYPGFNGQLLQPLGELEQNPTEPNACSVVLGISEIDIATKVYPNPVLEKLRIENNANIVKAILLNDARGKTIKKYSSVNEIDVSFLFSGIYYLQVYFENNSVEVIKLVK